MFNGRCYLCGERVDATYCEEHRWAAEHLDVPYREEPIREILVYADRHVPFDLTDLHVWALTTFTPQQIADISLALEAA
jgi:hypothetical protein